MPQHQQQLLLVNKRKCEKTNHPHICLFSRFFINLAHISTTSPISTTTTAQPPPPINQNPISDEPIQRWYRCAVCLERLFNHTHIVGSMGEKSELQEKVEDYNQLIPERRFLIVDWTFGNSTKMRCHKRRCSENIQQYASFCPVCSMGLNAPAQSCLGRTAAPTKRSHFRHYKRAIKSFSAKYQVIRTLLLEIELPNSL